MITTPPMPSEETELPPIPSEDTAPIAPPIQENEGIFFDLEVDPIKQEKPTGGLNTAKTVTEAQAASAAKMFRSLLNFAMPAGLGWYSGEDASRYKMSNSESKEFEDLCKDYLMTIQSAPSPTVLFLLGVAGLVAGKGMLAASDKKQRVKKLQAQEQAKKQQQAKQQQQQPQQQPYVPQQQQKPQQQQQKQSAPAVLAETPTYENFPELFNRRPNFLREGMEYLRPIENNRLYRKDERKDIVSAPMLEILQRVESSTQHEAAGRGWDGKKIQASINKKAKRILQDLQKKHNITQDMMV